MTAKELEMRDGNGKEFFEEIQPHILKLEEYLKNINGNLTHYRIEPFSKGKGVGALSQQLQKEPLGVGGLIPVEGFIMESIEIVEKLHDYRSRALLSVEHNKAQRKAERQDAWKLWSQKLIRWTLGTIVAVVLYSAAVWASENSGFIKIPIKDWFHQSEKSS